MLGFCYYHGKGVTQDYAQAANWFSKAKEQGHFRARLVLDLMQHDGLIRKVGRDGYTESINIYELARSFTPSNQLTSWVPGFGELITWHEVTGDKPCLELRTVLFPRRCHRTLPINDSAEILAYCLV